MHAPWPLLWFASVLLGASVPAPAAELRPTPVPHVDLFAYGDTRGGLLANVLMGRRLQPQRVHETLASALGAAAEEGEKAVLFLGDAVSHAGCDNLWSEGFFPAVERLRPAFAAPGGGLLFYPLVGDHEWKLVPRRQDERLAVECVAVLPLYGSPPVLDPTVTLPGPPPPDAAPSRVLRVPAEPEKRKTPAFFSIVRQVDCRGWEKACATLLANPGVPPGDIRRLKCGACAYEEERFEGSFATYAFRVRFTREAGFGPFQDAWRATADRWRGASWYAVDRSVGGDGGAARTLRVLMLDTMFSYSSRPDRLLSSQLDWIREEVRGLPAGSVLVVAGHEPPGSGGGVTLLYETALREALAAGVRVAAVLASHRHGFAWGGYEVSDGKRAQRVVFVISGDGGGKDLRVNERPGPGNVSRGGRLGSLAVRPLPEAPWFRDRELSRASAARLRITPGEVAFVPLSLDLLAEPAALSAGTPFVLPLEPPSRSE